MALQLTRSLIVVAIAATLSLPPALIAPAAAQVPSVIDLPSLGDAGADTLSLADERKLGESIMRQEMRDPAFLTDPDTSDYLNGLGYQLVAASPARDRDFTFFALRDSTLNAFALPGGFIFVHSGTLLASQSESELAAVLAHEIGHVEQRHIARMLAKQRESTAIAIGTLLLALLAARSNSNSSADLTQAAIFGGQAAAIQQQLNFSREAEREADRVGFQTLGKAGFDQRAMVTFFERLQSGSRLYESAAPAYLRTHPLTTERIGDIQARVKEAHVHQRADSLDYQLIRARLRVLQDETTQGARDAQAYFAAQIANHSAASEAAAYYGQAFAALKLSQTAAAYDSAQTARRMVRVSSAMLDKLVSETRFAAAGNNSAERVAAVQMARDAASRFPLSRLTALHYVDLLQQIGQNEAAVAFLRDQIALPRSDTDYYSLLARSYAELGHRTLHHQAVAEVYALWGATPAAVEQLQLARKANDADFYVLSEVDARLRQLQQQMREQREELARAGRRPPDDENKSR